MLWIIGKCNADTLAAGGEEGENYMDEFLAEYDFSEAQELIDEALPDFTMSVDELLAGIISGENVLSFSECCNQILAAMQAEWWERKELFAVLLLCGILASFCKNIAGLCENKQIIDLGYYFIYLLLAVFLFEAFTDAADIVRECLENITAFLSALLPSYFLAVGMAVGTTTAAGFYQIALVVICGVQYVFLLLLLPACLLYMFLSVISGLSGEDRMAGILGLLFKLIGYVQKTSLAIVGGLSAVQMCISPMVDGVSYGAAKKVLGALPGVGNITDSSLQLISGALLLIKNGIGVTILVLLLFLCLVPAVRVFTIVLILKVGSALMALVTDFRIVKCTDRVGTGSMQLLKLLVTAFTLNFVCIAIAAASRGI